MSFASFESCHFHRYLTSNILSGGGGGLLKVKNFTELSEAFAIDNINSVTYEV